MCGRYSFTNPHGDSKIEAIMNMVDRLYPDTCKKGEIFPGDTAPVILLNRGKIVAAPAVFGFPAYSGGKLILNARSETAAEKKSFAQALRETRAVIPASGFYEWSHDQEKTKYLFEKESSSAIYFCGLYRIMDGQCRFVILTRGANESMAGIHDRMPVIIDENMVRPYLTDYDAAIHMIQGPAPVLQHMEA